MTRTNRAIATLTITGLAAIVVACGQQSADKPAAVLEFFGIEPGMTVLDIFTGSGYYAEIIAGVVGDEGKVIAHSHEAYLGFVGDAFEERFGSGGLVNVEVLMAENNELTLVSNSLDANMLVLSFHDLYHDDPESDMLRKPDDNLEMIVFDPDIRGKTE